MFWIVDPDPYKATLDRWLQGSGLVEIDNYHVIARDAFCSLHVWGGRYPAQSYRVELGRRHRRAEEPAAKPNPNPDLSLGTFLGATTRDSLDWEETQGKPLFERALAKLGPVAEDEMYAFEPALCIGGKADLEHMVELNMGVRLMILDQLRR